MMHGTNMDKYLKLVYLVWFYYTWPAFKSFVIFCLTNNLLSFTKGNFLLVVS
jgi:hypothetical protein